MANRIEKGALQLGELYLFHRSEGANPMQGALWGVVGELSPQGVRLESASADMVDYHLWMELPEEFGFARLATREELRDYNYRLAWAECRLRLLALLSSGATELERAGLKIEKFSHIIGK